MDADLSLSRRRFVQALSLTGVGAGVLTQTGRTTAQVSDADRWPGFQNGSQNRGFAPDGANVRRGSTVDGETSAPNRIPGSPAADRDHLYVPLDDDGIGALSRETNEWVWTADVGYVQSTPGVGQDTVVVPADTGTGISNATLFALSTADGSVRWKQKQPQVYTIEPTVRDGTIYITYGDGNNRFNLYSLAIEDGSINWRAFGVRASAPVVTDEVVVIGARFMDGPVAAYDRDSGSRRWETRLGSLIERPVVAADGRVFALADGVLHCLDISDGTELWTSDGSYTSVPAVDDDRLYIGAGSGQFSALDPASGDVQWTYSGGAAAQLPVVTDQTVYARFDEEYGTTHTLAALDADDGSELWTRSFDDDVRTAPVVLRDGIYVVTGEETVVRLTETARSTTTAQPTTQAPTTTTESPPTSPDLSQQRGENDQSGTATPDDGGIPVLTRFGDDGVPLGVGAGVLGALSVGGYVGYRRYQTDDDADDGTESDQQAHDARGSGGQPVAGGTDQQKGRLTIENRTDQPTTCLLQLQTPDEVVLKGEVEIAAGESPSSRKIPTNEPLKIDVKNDAGVTNSKRIRDAGTSPDVLVALSTDTIEIVVD